jgi:hypothetical protein
MMPSLVFIVKRYKYAKHARHVRHIPVIPALRRLRQEVHRFKASLDYIVRPRLKKTKNKIQNTLNIPIIVVLFAHDSIFLTLYVSYLLN